jgi:hypothetical protein
MQQALNKSSLVGTTFAYDISCPDCSTEQMSDVYFLLATNFGRMSRTLSHTAIRYQSQRSQTVLLSEAPERS